MKRANSKRFALAVVMAGIAVLTVGCGASGSIAASTAAVTGLVSGGCVPISTAQIPVTGTNANLTATNLIAGQIPNGMSSGQMVIGGSVTVTPVTTAGVPSYYLTYQGSEASVALSVVPSNATATTTTPYGYGGSYGYGYGSSYQGPVTVTGVVTLSSLTQQSLYTQYGNPYGYGSGYVPGYYGTTTTTAPVNTSCISGIAIQAVQNYSQIFSGQIYLYMNNTAHGYIVDL